MQRLRGIYKLTKKEILTLWGAEYPIRAAFSYVATRELLRRDAGIATSRRRKMGTGREGKGPGDGIAWNWGSEGTAGESMGEDSKRAKGQKVKSHIWQKWKSESEKVNVVNGELGESVESVNVNAKWILIIRIKNPYNNVRA